MKHSGPFASLADLAGKNRMRALVAETKARQARADHAELGGFLERVAWMKERTRAMHGRNRESLTMYGALDHLERTIQRALSHLEDQP